MAMEKKTTTVEGDGVTFTVETQGAAFCVVANGEVVGMGAYSEVDDALVWHGRLPRQPVEVLLALTDAVLAMLEPFCRGCCEAPPLSEGPAAGYCVPCANSYGLPIVEAL